MGNSFGGGTPEMNNAGQEQAPIVSGPTSLEQLPRPQSIEAPLQVGNETEQAISNQEAQPTFSQPQPTPTQTPPVPPPQQPQQPSATDKLPVIAGHSNRIEKAWIDKGDKIVQETRDDPFSQKVRMDDLKDEYQTARYGGGGDAT